MEEYVRNLPEGNIWRLDILIFVSLGTNDKSFKRLLDAFEKEIKNGRIKDKVIVQSGFTKYSSKVMSVIDLMSMEDFKENIKNCDLLVTHGGVGTILDGLKLGKKIIAFPRLSKYAEHVNDHQIEILDEFYKEGYILTGKIKDLVSLIEESKTFIPKKYKSNNKNFNKMIEDFIDN